MSQFDTHVPCLGHISSEEILDISWIHDSDFDGKSILDYGCGFSDLLFQIWEYSTPKRLVWIDPIFQSDESIRRAHADTRKHIESLLKNFASIPDTRNKLKERQEVLRTFDTQTGNVAFYPDMLQLDSWTFDYIFISYVFAHIHEFLSSVRIAQEISRVKSETGKIIIIDDYNVLRDLQMWARVFVSGEIERITQSWSVSRLII